MGYGLYVLSPAIRHWVVTVACENASANLTPALRRQDHTISPSASSAFVKGAVRGHRSPPRVDDVGQRPSEWDGMANHSSIYDSEKQKYFFERGWTSRNSRSNKGEVICPSGQCVAGTIVDR
jgi:hypothetical protein